MIDMILLFVGIGLGAGLPGVVLGYAIGTARYKVKYDRNANLRRPGRQARRPVRAGTARQANQRSTPDHAQARFEAHQAGEGISHGTHPR